MGHRDPAIGADAWAPVYQRVAPDLVRFATLLVGPAAAEDVVSDAVIRVIVQASVDHIVNPTAYLYRAVANTAKNHLRGTGRRIEYERRRPGAATTGETEVRPEVARAVAALSPQQRAVIYLTYWADLTPSQVADHLDMSEGAVRRQLARGRKKLRGVLDA